MGGASTGEPRELEACQYVERVFTVLGKRWTGLLIDLLLQRPARFSELARAVPALSQRVLGERLRELEATGLVERSVDPGPPITVTYALTPAGQDLGPAMSALREWAKRLPEGGRETAEAERPSARRAPSRADEAEAPLQREHPGGGLA